MLNAQELTISYLELIRKLINGIQTSDTKTLMMKHNSIYKQEFNQIREDISNELSQDIIVRRERYTTSGKVNYKSIRS